MSTLTKKQETAIRTLVKGMTLPIGLGSRESACSIAAINLALTGELTDKIPDCMSLVIGRWIITIQDLMPSEIRNSAKWKRLLPLAAGTGREHEVECLAIILDWMWGTVLPVLQPYADKRGFGKEWLAMTTGRTVALAQVAEKSAAHDAFASNVTTARRSAYTACHDAAHAADADSDSDERSAAYAAYAAYNVARNQVDAWPTFDPCALLSKLIEVSA